MIELTIISLYNNKFNGRQKSNLVCSIISKLSTYEVKGMVQLRSWKNRVNQIEPQTPTSLLTMTAINVVPQFIRKVSNRN